MNTIACFDMDDAALFHDRLKEIEDKHAGKVRFRGQINADWKLVPTACRGTDYYWTGMWIESFVDRYLDEYSKFLHLSWSSECESTFKTRFELALRCYIEREVLYRFQQYAEAKGFVDLSAAERIDRPFPLLITEYLKKPEIPIADPVKYVSLLAQHHGIPTRLLDWTDSLDVALDFATRGLDSVVSSDSRLIVWLIVEWNFAAYASQADEDEDKLELTIGMPSTIDYDRIPSEHVLCASSSGREYLLRELNKRQSVFVRSLHPQSSYSYMGEHDLRIELTLHPTGLRQYDTVGVRHHDIFVAAQRSSAIIDVRHDRHYYDRGYAQPFESRLSNSSVPSDKVYRFTLPHRKVGELKALTKREPVPRIYGTPMFEEFGKVDATCSDFEEALCMRKHNFLAAVGELIQSEVDFHSNSDWA